MVEGFEITSVHAPLPYLVRMRVVENQDASPAVFERHVTAYSVLEAIDQAVIEMSCELHHGDAEIIVESVGPDDSVQNGGNV